MNGKSAVQVKNFDFDNDTSENIFSHPYITYIANEKLQGEEQFHSKNYHLEMPSSHAKMHLKSAQQKLNFVTVKAISKGYSLIVVANVLARSRTAMHSSTASFLIETTLCETNNIPFYQKLLKTGQNQC